MPWRTSTFHPSPLSFYLPTPLSFYLLFTYCLEQSPLPSTTPKGSDSNAALDIELSRAKKSSPRKVAGGSSKYVPDGNGRKKMRTVWTDEQDVEISNAVLIAKRETVHKPGGTSSCGRSRLLFAVSTIILLHYNQLHNFFLSIFFAQQPHLFYYICIYIVIVVVRSVNTLL